MAIDREKLILRDMHGRARQTVRANGDVLDVLDPIESVAAEADEIVSPADGMRALLEGQTDDASRVEGLGAEARVHAVIEAANYVKDLRREFNLTQQQLSDMSGIRQATISDIERLRLENGPNTTTLATLAIACGRKFKLAP